MSAPDGVDYRRLFESAPTPYLVLDPDLVVVAVNDAYLTATLNTRESLLGKHLFDAFPDNPGNLAADGVRNLRQSLRSVLTTGRPDAMTLQRYDIPADPSRPDGEYVERYWSPVNTPVLDDDGAVVNIIHRVEDVTEFVRMRRVGQQQRRAAEDAEQHSDRMENDLIARAREVQDVNHQLREANEQLAAVGATLRQQQEAKDRFIATLSHELRNPLAAAQVAVELLAEQIDDHPALGVLQRQIDALVRMTDDLLDATRAMTGRLAVERGDVNLRAVVTEAVGDVERELRESGRTLRVTLPEQDVAVVGDRIRLGQMLGNLLSNARKYTRPGSAIDVELTPGDDGTATLTVRDDGIGFDPAIAERLFEVFARAETKAGTDVGGLGVGLAIVRGVVELHGGTVTAHSEGEGMGASFVVTLPLAGETSETPPERARPVESSGGRRVLIIEDNADLAATYRMLLERHGDVVTIASTGKSGLEQATSAPFDVVLCDIGLPDIDGWEVAWRLRDLPKRDRMLVVAVSGFGQESDRERSRHAGFDAHIAKPMRLSDLDAAWAAVARPG